MEDRALSIEILERSDWIGPCQASLRGQLLKESGRIGTKYLRARTSASGFHLRQPTRQSEAWFFIVSLSENHVSRWNGPKAYQAGVSSVIGGKSCGYAGRFIDLRV